jgi:uncharacterized protein (DUF58 family)
MDRKHFRRSCSRVSILWRRGGFKTMWRGGRHRQTIARVGVKLVYRPIYWIYRAASGLIYWSQRRFTLPGIYLAGGFIVTGATGVDIENTVTYQSFTLLLGFLLLAFAASFFFWGKFSTTRFLPRVATVGETLRYRVSVRNLTAKNQAGLTLLEDLTEPYPSFADWLDGRSRRKSPFRLPALKESEVPPLLARGEAETSMEIFPLRRGILCFTGVTLARPDPFGLFRSFIKVHLEQKVLILPRRYSIPPIALPGALRYQEGGSALLANIGRSDEFMALRDYRQGDPWRHIHWQSWAKTGQPIVKEFEDEFLPRCALALDTFGDESNSELLEEAVSVAASFAWTALTQESLLDLLFVGDQSNCFTAGRGHGRADQMLEILALANNCANKKFEALERLVLHHLSVVSGCICILQSWDEARIKFVEKLRALGVPLLVLVVAPPGQIKWDAGPLRDAPECFHVLEIGKIAETLAKLK